MRQYRREATDQTATPYSSQTNCIGQPGDQIQGIMTMGIFVILVDSRSFRQALHKIIVRLSFGDANSRGPATSLRTAIHSVARSSIIIKCAICHSVTPFPILAGLKASVRRTVVPSFRNHDHEMQLGIHLSTCRRMHTAASNKGSTDSHLQRSPFAAFTVWPACDHHPV